MFSVYDTAVEKQTACLLSPPTRTTLEYL